MPQLFTDEGVRVGTLAGHKEWHIKHFLDCDEKTLYFKYPKTGPYAAQLAAEAYPLTKYQYVGKLLGVVKTVESILFQLKDQIHYIAIIQARKIQK